MVERYKTGKTIQNAINQWQGEDVSFLEKDIYKDIKIIKPDDPSNEDYLLGNYNFEKPIDEKLFRRITGEKGFFGVSQRAWNPDSKKAREQGITGGLSNKDLDKRFTDFPTTAGGLKELFPESIWGQHSLRTKITDAQYINVLELLARKSRTTDEHKDFYSRIITAQPTTQATLKKGPRGGMGLRGAQDGLLGIGNPFRGYKSLNLKVVPKGTSTGKIPHPQVISKDVIAGMPIDLNVLDDYIGQNYRIVDPETGEYVLDLNQTDLLQKTKPLSYFSLRGFGGHKDEFITRATKRGHIVQIVSMERTDPRAPRQPVSLGYYLTDTGRAWLEENGINFDEDFQDTIKKASFPRDKKAPELAKIDPSPKIKLPPHLAKLVKGQHSIRKTSADIVYLLSNEKIGDVQEHLGHSTPASTEHYIQTGEGISPAIVQKIFAHTSEQLTDPKLSLEERYYLTRRRLQFALALTMGTRRSELNEIKFKHIDFLKNKDGTFKLDENGQKIRTMRVRNLKRPGEDEYLLKPVQQNVRHMFLKPYLEARAEYLKNKSGNDHLIDKQNEFLFSDRISLTHPEKLTEFDSWFRDIQRKILLGGTAYIGAKELLVPEITSLLPRDTVAKLEDLYRDQPKTSAEKKERRKDLKFKRKVVRVNEIYKVIKEGGVGFVKKLAKPLAKKSTIGYLALEGIAEIDKRVDKHIIKQAKDFQKLPEEQKVDALDFLQNFNNIFHEEIRYQKDIWGKDKKNIPKEILTIEGPTGKTYYFKSGSRIAFKNKDGSLTTYKIEKGPKNKHLITTSTIRDPKSKGYWQQIEDLNYFVPRSLYSEYLSKFKK